MFIDTGRIPATGNLLIDKSHRHLAEMINALFDQWCGGAEGAALRPGFDRFLDAVERHFAEEEDIALAMGFPNVPEHAGKHRALMAALTSHVHALTDDSETGDRRIDLFSLIDQMLYEHEMLDDQEFWPLFNAVHHTPALGATAEETAPPGQALRKAEELSPRQEESAM
ncbi:MAG: hemerythrin domain-containing protein [Rhodospirillaceae bacterium]